MKVCEYRPYESFQLLDEALQVLTGDFTIDFKTFTDWCIENYRTDINFRENNGYSREPYGLNFKEGKYTTRVSELKVHAQTFITLEKEKWCWLFDTLQDLDSKKTLINVLAYRCLGWRYVPMPLDNAKAWAILNRLQQDAEKTPKSERIDIGFFNMVLSPFKINCLGRNINILATSGCVFSELLYSQYNYRGKNIKLTPEIGDVVLDCGACHGATSLYLASQVGETGKVFSFEFFPDNIEIFNSNLQNNPTLSEKITLVKAPVWCDDNARMEVRGVGPATRVILLNKKNRLIRLLKKNLDDLAVTLFFKKNKKYTSKYRFLVNSSAIDDEYSRQSMQAVNFIKMDIEGAELCALKGAKATIRKHSPTLAICVYHNLRDFHEIPKFISDLNLGYEFYLQHSTVHGDETVLFAHVPKNNQ